MAENCNFVWSLDHEPKTKPANSVKKTRLFLIYTYQYVCKLEINVHVLSWYCRWYTPACFDISYHIHGFLLCSIHVYLCKRRIMFHMWIKLILRSCGMNKPHLLSHHPLGLHIYDDISYPPIVGVMVSRRDIRLGERL